MNNLKELLTKTRTHMMQHGARNTLRQISSYVARRVSVMVNNKIEYKVPSNQQRFFALKQQPTIYIIAGVPYYDIGGGQRCAQLSKCFNKMGFPVVHLYAMLHEEKKNPELLPPVKLHAYLDGKILKHLEESVKKEDIFIFEAPMATMEPVVDLALARGCKIIYENIDNWETGLGSGFFNEITLKKMLSAADILVGTAKPLVEQLESYLKKYEISKENQQILYLANAVDDELFCGLKNHDKPLDLVQGECTLLYYGSLWGEWFAWDVVIDLAKRHPEYAINMIGNANSIKKLALECPSNIHFLGAKKQIELPAYLQHVDYAILPFKRGEIGDYVSPLKIFEYIAMYAKVLSTTLPDIAGYPNVYFGNTAEEWEQIILTNPSVNRLEADAFIGQNTWYYRIYHMLDRLYDQHEEPIFKNNLTIVVKPHKDEEMVKKCIAALMKYQDRYAYQICTEGEAKAVNVADLSTDYVLFLDATQWPTHPYWLDAYAEVVSSHPQCGKVGCIAQVSTRKSVLQEVEGYQLEYMPPQMLCRNDIQQLKTEGLLICKAGVETYYCPYLGVRKVL